MDFFFNQSINALLLVVLPLLLIRLALGLLGKRVDGEYHCKQCGYNREGIPDTSACPECGHGPAFDGDYSHYYRGTRFFKPKRIRNDLILISFCIALLISLNSFDNWRKEVYSRFISAIERGDIREVESLLDRHPELAQDRFRFDPALSIPGHAITQAVQHSDYQMVKLLLNYGADPTLAKQSLLLNVVYNKDYSSLKLLLEGGADPNHSKSHGILGYVVATMPPRYTQIMLENGGDPKQFTRYTVLTNAMQNPERYAVCKLLLDAGADPNQLSVPPWQRSPPLIDAIIHGDVRTVELLLEYGADIKGKHYPSGDTALEIARARASEPLGKEEEQIVKLLEDAAAKLNNKSDIKEENSD